MILLFPTKSVASATDSCGYLFASASLIVESKTA